MRHHILAGLAAAILAMPGGAAFLRPAAAQELAPAVIVNDQAITAYEIAQRARFMQVLRAPDSSPAAAEAALIDERLQVEEGRRLRISVTEADIRGGMTEFAARGGLDADSFVAQLGSAGVDEQTFRDFVTAGLIWRQVLRERVAPAVSVSDREVARVRQSVLEQPRVTEVLISELIMPAPQGSEDQVLARAQQLSDTVRSEGAFAEAARRYSATPTAGSGGRLPWTPISQLPEGLAPILLALQPGQITQPLSIPGAVVLFFVRDTRGEQRPGATSETVRYLSLTLASVAEAQTVQRRADTCDMLYVAAQGRPVQDQSVASGSAPAELASLDPNESVILNRGNAADLVMLCSRGPTLLAEGGPADRPIPGLPTGSLRPAAPSIPIAGGAEAVTLPEEAEADAGFAPVPSVDEARGRLFDQKVNQGSEALLAELRANAIIRRP